MLGFLASLREGGGPLAVEGARERLFFSIAHLYALSLAAHRLADFLAERAVTDALSKFFRKLLQIRLGNAIIFG